MNRAIALFSSTPLHTLRYKMTATLWIHRSSGYDLLVRLPTAHDAYDLGVRFLFAHQTPVEEENFVDNWNETTYTTDGMFHVGDTPYLQLSVHPGEFHPENHEYLGISEWATETFIVTVEEAMALGEGGIPDSDGSDEEVKTPTINYESDDEDWRQEQIERHRYDARD